jgi:hypothetical protein
VCLVETCPNFIEKKTYCMDCLEKGVHKHRPFTLIIDYLHDVRTQWSALQQEYAMLVPKAEASYQKYEPLIKYYEKELIAASAGNLGSDREQCISGDYLAMMAAKEEIGYCNQRMIDIDKDGLILEVDQVHSKYLRLSRLVQRTQYLSEISEDVMYQAYSDVIKMEQSRSFEGFTDEHREAYLRLKAFAIIQKR